MKFFFNFILIQFVTSLDLECIFIKSQKCLVKSDFKITSKDDRDVTCVTNSDELKDFSTSIVEIQMEKLTMNFFPRKLEDQFEKISFIYVQDCDLHQITEDDLKPFRDLKFLSISGNKNFKQIEADLFAYNPKIKTLLLNRNSIEIVEPFAFGYLEVLEVLDFESNTCHSKRANEREKTVELIYEIYAKCLDKKKMEKLKSKSLNESECSEEKT